MKTTTPKTYLHSRKIVMTFKERNTFLEDKEYYLALGYPEAIAEQRAYDHYYINKKSKLGV